MQIFGQTGSLMVPKPDTMLVRRSYDAPEKAVTPPLLTAPNDDALSYLAAVVRGDIKPSGLASLDVNVIVVEILQAAHESARTGKEIKL